MNLKTLSISHARQILNAAQKSRILVVGDVMLDQFIWGSVARISPEAPVPVVDFERESFMPGGAANVARNLTALKVSAKIFGVVGKDNAANELRKTLSQEAVNCEGLITSLERHTSLKTRIIAHKQQVCRVDRESRRELFPSEFNPLVHQVLKEIDCVDAVIVGDYGKGVVNNLLLHQIKERCYARAVWLSFDPKPVHQLNLNRLSLITPNRKETFELANLRDETKHSNPLADKNLMLAAERLLKELHPAVLLITLGEMGMLLCERNKKPIHIPTVAREVFDVSGAGDTVIATFTLAIAAGASPLEAAIISKHAGGIVVGKIRTTTVSPEELLESFGK
jgi:rfaE bifunctional protein kinase chain/domain